MFIGIDIGTSGTKALLLKADGVVAASATAPHPLFTPKPGWTQQRPDDWFGSACKAVKLALKKGKVKPKEVAAIGFSGQMHGSVFLDAKLRPVRPALLWNDQRTADDLALFTAACGGRAALVAKAGSPALTGFTAPKVAWLRRNEPKNFAKVAHVVLPKDYVRLRFTGELACDYSDASGTLFLDVTKRAWDAGLAKAAGLTLAQLPGLMESSTQAGQLNTATAKLLGLPAGIPVVAGGADNACGAVGLGIVKEGVAMASLGTSGVVFAATDSAKFDPAGSAHTMCSAVPNGYCIFGCMLSAAGSLQWYRDKLFPGVAFDTLMQEAEKIAPGAQGVSFLPYLAGERCPHPDPAARGAFTGLSLAHDRGHLTRAVVEGVTFGMKDVLGALQAAGVSSKNLRLTGGGAQSKFWRQLQADTYGLPCETVAGRGKAGSEEAGGPAFGAALLAAVGVGAWDNLEAACKKSLAKGVAHKPNAKAHAGYGASHAAWRKLYPALAGVRG